MNRFRDFLHNLFGSREQSRKPGPKPGEQRPRREEPSPESKRIPETAYRKGEFIGQKYEVYGILGAGGFGVVYLVYAPETKSVYALKTFHDEFLGDLEARKRFRKEAQLWVDLGRHPFILRAHFVDEIAGRLYIAFEYIARNADGYNSLDECLRRKPPDLAQSLRWAIQFCYGMEYAYGRGVRCHRDVKPSNILIGEDNTVKIADFGIAATLGASSATAKLRLNVHGNKLGLSGQTVEGMGFGTPPYMAPEQFVNAAECDERSDVYSFGVVLYQMASGGEFPFPIPLPRDVSEEEARRCWRTMYMLHKESPIPRLRSPLFPIIRCCLEKKPSNRYASFRDLRSDLEPLLKGLTGEVIALPEPRDLEVWEWHNRGASLDSLGHFDEAIRCFEKALALDRRYSNSWNYKGVCLNKLKRFDAAIPCFDSAIALDPRYKIPWNNKGISLNALGRFDEALRCYDTALELDPHYVFALLDKANCLRNLGRPAEALRFYDRALTLDPQYAGAWNNKALTLKEDLGRFEEALHCCDNALRIDPMNSRFWDNKGLCLHAQERFAEALPCLLNAIEIDPRNAKTLNTTGATLHELGRLEEALPYYQRALELEPKYVAAWSNKAIAEDKLGRRADAISSYEQLILVGDANSDPQVQYARKRLSELKDQRNG